MIQIHIKQSVIISLFFSDELPVQLTLPRAMREAKNHQQLSSLALLGQGKVLSCKHFLYDVLKVVNKLACSCRKILTRQFVFAANASNSATIKHWISHECGKVLCVHAHFFPLFQKWCQIQFSLNTSNSINLGFLSALSLPIFWQWHQFGCSQVTWCVFTSMNVVASMDFSNILALLLLQIFLA